MTTTWRSTRDDPPAVGMRIFVRNGGDSVFGPEMRDVTSRAVLEIIRANWSEWRPAQETGR